MPIFGRGYKVVVESLVHDERGFYAPRDSDYKALITRLALKILKRLDYVYEHEALFVEDAEVLIVSYGSTARSAYSAVLELRKRGVKAGFLRIKTLWPLDEERIRSTTAARKIIVVENNIGKLYFDIDRIFKDREVFSAPVLSLELPKPEEVLEAIEIWL
jgi:2-oxoglutarate ferredoxin oxidoreductase subunit alpha